MGSTDNDNAPKGVASATELYPPYTDYDHCRRIGIRMGIMWGLCGWSIIYGVKDSLPFKSKTAVAVSILGGCIIGCGVTAQRTAKCKTYTFDREHDEHNDGQEGTNAFKSLWREIQFTHNPFKDRD